MKKHKSAKIFILIAIVLAAAWLIFVRLMNEGWDEATSPVADITQYENIRDNYWRPQMVEHFPETIPGDAKNTTMYFMPAFLQGGSSFQLRYSSDNEEISKLYGEFSNQKIESFYGGTKSEIPVSEFENDFEVIVLMAESCDTNDCGFKWNHGKTKGVAISQQKNEIIYWAESW